MTGSMILFVIRVTALPCFPFTNACQLTLHWEICVINYVYLSNYCYLFFQKKGQIDRQTPKQFHRPMFFGLKATWVSNKSVLQLMDKLCHIDYVKIRRMVIIFRPLSRLMKWVKKSDIWVNIFILRSRKKYHKLSCT